MQRAGHPHRRIYSDEDRVNEHRHKVDEAYLGIEETLEVAESGGVDAIHPGYEAMKMETVVRAPRAGSVKELLPAPKSAGQAGDLLVVVG